ncbi:MAG: elongation factor 4, partial [Clostridia bacterium]|nr:elongation factor 4 [Clostridia bacterium]
PLISAKDGINIKDVLEAVVKYVPAPSGDIEKPLKALIFDSYYDSYKGVIAYVRVFDGKVKKGDKIRMMNTKKEFEVVEAGIISPNHIPVSELQAGDVGYITASIKDIRSCRVGDTVTLAENPTETPMPGYKKVTPMVYCGVYPAEGEKYENVRDALEKLQVNDAALEFEPETSVALGFGFRCGFLGLLHMEIIQERLEREFNLDMITTAPSVVYRVVKHSGEVLMIQNPANLPPQAEIDHIEEPIVKADIIVPKDFVGAVMELAQDRRGEMINMEYLDPKRVTLHYNLPLNEVVYDFFDSLKSRTKGYGSFDYEFKEYVESTLVKLDILINKEQVDALSFIVHETTAQKRGRIMCEKLKDEIPKHQFPVPIQAAVGSKVIARETISAYRKDVLAKCYGGDISRKRKLLEKQKEGKKRMRQVGNVEVPQKAFMSVLKLDD